MDKKINENLSFVQPKLWKLFLKFIGSLLIVALSVFAFYVNPGFGLVLFLWGLIWTSKPFLEIIRSFKNSKNFPIIKKRFIQILVISLVCALMVGVFNFIVGLSATTVIIILLVLIILK